MLLKLLTKRLTGIGLVAALFLIQAGESVYGQNSPNLRQPEISGRLEVRINNCNNPDHKGPHSTYLIRDLKSRKLTELDVSKLDKDSLKPGAQIKLRGGFKHGANLPGPGRPFVATEVIAEGSSGESEPDATAPSGEEAVAAGEPAVAEGAPAITTLSCLLIFANTNNYTVPAATITTVKGMLFNDANNVSKAIEEATYGHFNLSHGATATVTLNYDASTKSSSQIESDMESAAVAMGYNLNSYGRILIFQPQYGPDFTAYGYINGDTTVYSYGWTTGLFDGFVHELGHNFGFNHASKDGNTYGDESCAMGYSHNGTNSATYSAPKKAQKGWFSPYSGSYAALTGDATYDLYPVSLRPDVTPGMRTIKINGTNYFISYRRNRTPYGWLRRSADYDKVFVHSQSGSGTSTRVGDLISGGSYTAGTTTVTFERYGDTGKNYATVSFDLDDGNTKPVANAQSVNTFKDTPLAITLSGSDADSNPLTYTKVTDPIKGALSGTAPNFTYTPSSNYVGSDSFVFKVNDGKISSFATISITVKVPNVAPVANNNSVNVFLNTPESITLTATDGNGDILTYSVVSGPANGALSGTPPNLIYTPNNNFFGSDSFTFKANDGYANSNTATVSIAVASFPNTPPTANAGPDQNVYWQNVTTVPGLAYGTVAGNIDTTTANPKTEILINVSSKTEDTIAASTTEIYTGMIYDADGQISFTEHIDDKARIWIDGVLKINNDAYGTRTSTANLNLTPGWHDIEIRISNGGGGSGPTSGIGIGYDPAGGTTWKVLTDPGDGSFLKVNQNQGGGVVNLDGTAGDVNSDPLTTSWSVVSAPSSATVTFGNASLVDTTAQLSAIGTYVLRLTVDDGYAQTTDDVTITVNAPLPAFYAAWSSGGGFANALTDISPNGDQDGDGMSNTMEFAFGTDPTVSNASSVAANGSANGLPTPIKGAGGVMELVFVRRKDHDTSGSASYTVEFSSDLGSFYGSVVTPTFVADSSVNSNYEVVKVAYPASLPNGQSGNFGRIRVEFVP